MTKALVKDWKELINCMMRLKNNDGVIKGRVMAKNSFVFDAPSMRQASYSSLGICFNPARKITIEDPKDQTTSKLIVNNAYFGCSRKGIAGIPIFPRTVFTRPVRENMNRHKMDMETLAPKIEGK